MSVWLFRVVAPDCDGDWWGTTDGETKADALARVRRRMPEHLGTEGHGPYRSGEISVEVWPHDSFTVAMGYL